MSLTKLASVLLMSVLAAPLLAAERSDIGLSAGGTVIERLRVDGPGPSSLPTVLLIGGLDGPGESAARVEKAVAAFAKLKHPRFRLLAVPLANPEARPLRFPPSGVAYRENVESNVLWRWIGVQAPDLVLIAGDDDHGLAQALSNNVVAEVGRIPARVVPAGHDLLDVKAAALAPSEAHREMDRRRARTPRQLAEELAKYYGHDFDQPWYIQAIALIGQVRLGHLDEVQRLVEPYVDGTRDSLARANSLVLAGHMIFTELARRTGDARYVQMVRKVADLGFEQDGSLKESMPYHDQYSDSVFMGTVMPAQAGGLTGERKYFDVAARHIAFMQKIVLRPDGLYRHQPLTDAAWARGNAFPAMGLALALAEFPHDHPAYAKLLADFQSHMRVLAKWQTPDGLWRNVVDYPGAYPELSATAMIGWAMLRGVRSGWMPAAEFQPRVDKAWQAVLERIGPEGHVVDGCESTLKMKSVEEYLHRAAILGPDPRTGAMALLFATERMTH
ncbi:MAG TPA: glycoside hydrolase family 88 protein [Steroidobacteraceae bacterium]|jgi:rhamnogalacturonyl hydrolase YesR|nr:glycoside hydrolase family 88 protein [Steroidobacteraceae bacterium]